MQRVYKPDVNVYEAALQRIEYVFNRFPKIIVSFSGGKDSGVLLNLVCDYMRRNNITRKVGVQVMDNEANYEYSLEFMHRIIRANRDLLDVYWNALPITLGCTVSAYRVDWQCWAEHEKEKWVRPRPEDDYVINFDNHPYDFFEENMDVYRFWDKFSEWYADGELCANLIGIRTSESLNRYRTIMNEDKKMIDGKPWTKQNSEHAYNVYPIYDWRTEDIWVANAQNEWDYNKLYDVFYMAGVPVHSMRVASPFMSESKASLNLYRVIDPHTWAKLCARVQGANFVATYGKQLGYHSFSLPEGHTWKSFVKFLLDTLPDESAENFKKRIAQSIKYWGRVGRGLPDSVIRDLKDNGVKFDINGYTRHGRKDLRRVRIRNPPDHLDCLSCHNSDVTSWKRFAITILKNDHTCKYLGLAPTQEQQKRQKQIQTKYGSLVKEKAA